jgi:hypothetical protein
MLAVNCGKLLRVPLIAGVGAAYRISSIADRPEWLFLRPLSESGHLKENTSESERQNMSVTA